MPKSYFTVSFLRFRLYMVFEQKFLSGVFFVHVWHCKRNFEPAWGMALVKSLTDIDVSI